MQIEVFEVTFFHWGKRSHVKITAGRINKFLTYNE